MKSAGATEPSVDRLMEFSPQARRLLENGQHGRPGCKCHRVLAGLMGFSLQARRLPETTKSYLHTYASKRKTCFTRVTPKLWQKHMNAEPPTYRPLLEQYLHACRVAI